MKQAKISRLGKQFIILIEQELLAIISVGIVLAFLFSRASAAGLPEESLIEEEPLQTATVSTQTVTDVSPPAGEALFHGQPTINFGPDIKGINRADFESWERETGNKNLGNYLQITENNEVKIIGVANGTHNIYVKALGTLTINGIGFTFKTIRTLVKTIQVTDGTITIKFTAGARIYNISTLQLEKETAEEEIPAVPTSIAILPYHSTVVLNKYIPATFRPLVIVLDPDGRQINITSGLLKWTSSDPAIATVDNNGLVLPKTPGAVTITVQVNGTELVASTSLLIRAAEEVPIIDITPRTQSATTSTESSSAGTGETITNTNTISGFFSDLLNLKPSSASNTIGSQADTSPQVVPTASPQTQTPLTSIIKTAASLINGLAASVQKGATTAFVFVQQQISQLVSQLIH